MMQFYVYFTKCRYQDHEECKTFDNEEGMLEFVNNNRFDNFRVFYGKPIELVPKEKVSMWEIK